MPSKVSIFNAALTELGEDRVTSPSEDTEPAKVCLARYDDVRDAVLRAHPWNSAKRRASLASTTAPAFGFANAFVLPTDPFCLRVFRLDPDTHGLHPTWKVEGRQILTDEGAPLNIEFIARITDEQEFDALLADAIAMRLGAAVAYRLTNSRSKEKEVRELYRRVLREARSVDGQEGTTDPPLTDEFLDSRDNFSIREHSR